MSNSTTIVAPTSSLLRLAEQHEWFMATADAAQTSQQARQQESAAAAIALRIGVAVGIISGHEATQERASVVRLLSDLAGTNSPQRDELQAWITAYDATTA
jgi:3-deoxy-D-arabino-heptulosonate 7-phosphate (DAHP) synthase class II